MRQPKPFFRKFTGTWYVQIGKQQINLGKDKAAAFQKYHELMCSRGRAKTTFDSVPHLLDAYLEWLNKNRAEGTYKKAKHYLTLFARRLGPGFPMAKLDGIHCTQWVEDRQDWASSTGNDAVSTVQRACNWAVKRGHITTSPVANVENKPKKSRRETVFTPVQWKEIRSEVKDQQFRDLLDFMWATGCRPIEARTLEVHHVDLDNAMAIFPPSEAKGEEHERVIFMPDEAVEICRRLMSQHKDGPLFRNTKGRPWTKDAINCRFQRLKKKLNRPMCAYAIRHSFATEGLKQGTDSLTLAQLMGHSDTSMLARHYAHLARNPDYLRETIRKLRAS
jgi:integrase